MSPRIQTSPPMRPAASSRFLQFRPRVWAALVALFALGYGAHFLWQRTAPTIAAHQQYQLDPAAIRVTPPPPWIRSDIKAEVLRDSGLADSLTILESAEALSRRVKEAFEFHPWIASVDRITKVVPKSLQIDLTYRRPVAAVESSDSTGVSFLPVDEYAIRLPEYDLTDAERRHLPRISGINGRPLIGDIWDDPGVVGGAKLAAALADVWQELRLIEILSTRVQPTTSNAKPDYRFELVTSGGTRILWGAAPGQEIPVGESPLDMKRRRLMDYATQHGRLEYIDGPERLDVRTDLVVTPRAARKKSDNTTR